MTDPLDATGLEAALAKLSSRCRNLAYPTHPPIFIEIADALDEVRAYLTASATGGWQPIETAPKDGTRVLCTYRHKGVWVHRVVHANRLGNWLSDPGDWNITPTHWQPLPPPPPQEPSL